MNAQPTTPTTITVYNRELSFDVPQITNFQDVWFNEYTESRRKIAAKRYWDNVAKMQVISYDKDLLLCFYEIVFYITNGLLDAFDGVFGSVTYSVEFVGSEPIITINTPNGYRKISDDSELIFTKVNIKTLERILGVKVVKELKATLPVNETAKKAENELCFEIGKSEAKRLSAAQIKAYNNPKDNEMIYANTGHAYWTYSVNDGIGYFSPVNAKPVKINLDYFSGFEFFIVESGKNVIIFEKKTGFKVTECMMLSFLDSELVKLSNHTVELSDLIQSAKKQIPFTFDINDSIESINAKRIAQNEFYVFGTTVEAETIIETVETVKTPNFDELSGSEKSFAKNYINAELKTRNVESLICEFETALLTCKESDKLSYYYALNMITTMQATTPQPTNEATPQPELINLSNVSNTELDYMIRFFPTQKEVSNYDSHTEKTHISALAEKNKRQGEELKEILATTPQPETLTVGQVIQGENCRLVVTKVAEGEKKETNQQKETMKPLSKKTEQIVQAQILGTLAFKNGLKRVAAYDTELTKIFADRQIGETPKGEASTANIMKAWYNSWDNANIASWDKSKLSSLAPKELETFNILVRLGDSKELAYNTVLENRENEAKQESAKEFYNSAYTN